MKKMFGFRIMAFSLGLAACAALSAPAPAYAQGDYDLQMQSIEGYPAPLQAGCNNRLKPHFSINGADDRNVPSGGAFVHFRYRTGTQSPWTDIGDLTVTYSTTDLGGNPYPFASGQAWPDDYDSVNGGFTDNNSVKFYLSSGVTQISVEATVNYKANQTDPNNNAIVDKDPSNNTLETSFNVVPAQSCTVPDDVIDICKKFPRICSPIECRTPGCIFMRFDPENCPMCGGLLEVIVSLPDDYRVVVYTKDNREVARSKPLEKAVRIEGKTYSQKLVFESKKGESYVFKAVSEKGTRSKVAFKPGIQIRKIEKNRVAPGNVKNIAPIIEKSLTR